MIYFTFFEKLEGYRDLFPSTITFRNIFDDSYLDMPEVKTIVEEIDNSEVIQNGIIYSRFFKENMTVERLSGGSKCLILPIIMNKEYPDTKWLISSLNLGNNCVKPMCELSKIYDIYLSIVTPLDIADDKFKNYDFYSLDFNIKVESFRHYLQLRSDFADKHPTELGVL